MVAQVIGEVRNVDDVLALATFLGSDYFSTERMREKRGRVSTASCIIDREHGMLITSYRERRDQPRVYRVVRYEVTDHARRAGRRNQRFDVYEMGEFPTLHEAKREMWALFEWITNVCGAVDSSHDKVSA